MNKWIKGIIIIAVIMCVLFFVMKEVNKEQYKKSIIINFCQNNIQSDCYVACRNVNFSDNRCLSIVREIYGDAGRK